MLSPSLRADIEVTVKIPDQTWPVSVDLAEFDLALLNIAVNARDAMPEGGMFRVEARNVTLDAGDPAGEGLAGDFVAVTLSDTGAGMAPEVAGSGFRALFHDKGDRAGIGARPLPGLRLRQAERWRRVDRRAQWARAPRITLFLPRAVEESAAAASHVTAAPLALSGRILVVEDEADVARVTIEVCAGHRLSGCRGERRPCRIGPDRAGSDDRAGVVRCRDARRDERS